jgi:hypothetical protein
MLFRIAGICGVCAHLIDWLLMDRRHGQSHSTTPRAGYARLSGVLIAAIVLAGVAVFAAILSVEGADNKTATPYSVGQLVDSPQVGGKTYATVHGYVYDWYVATTKNDQYDHASYLLGDPTTNKWIIVQSWKSEADFASLVADDGSVTLTGMLRTDHGEVSDALTTLGSHVPDVSISHDILLKEGQTPANQTVMLAVAGVVGALSLILFVGWAIGYVVFRAQKSRPALSTGGIVGSVPVRVTGLVPWYYGGERTLEKKAELRVSPTDPAQPAAANPPVSLVWTGPTGETGLDLGPDLSRAALGTAYPLRGARPALRVRYLKFNLVFTFDNEDARNQAFDSLRLYAGLVTAPEGASAAR